VGGGPCGGRAALYRLGTSSSERPDPDRLDRRREELGRRVAMMEAAGNLDEPGGEIAFAAVMDEMRHLRELYEAMLLVAIRERWNL
jgi:hypothetical protein